MTRNLSSSVLEKFNGYEMIRQKLQRKEKIDVTPIDIVYESSYDESITILCFFTDQMFLGYKSY